MQYSNNNLPSRSKQFEDLALKKKQKDEFFRAGMSFKVLVGRYPTEEIDNLVIQIRKRNEKNT